MAENVAGRGNKEDRNHHAHARCQRGVHARRGLDALNIQGGKYESKKRRPNAIGNSGSEDVGLLADPDDADHRIEHVVHHHAPSGDVAERGIDLLADIGEGRASAGISPRHAAIADRRKQHGHHGDQNGGDHVAMAAIAEHAEHRHGRNRLNDDDAVKNQVPKSEGAPQAGRSGSGCHLGVLDYACAKLSILKRFRVMLSGAGLRKARSGVVEQLYRIYLGQYSNPYPRASCPDIYRVLYSRR